MSNQKDGVGKVTITVNVAGALNQRGRDVLLVDLDPQGNATEGLGFADAYDAEPPSLFNVLTDSEQRGEIKHLVREHAEMDVVPSNVDHHHTEREMTHVRRPTEQLALALEGIGQDYDYVLIDCPPSLGHLTDNALYAAQNLLIPALAESTSKRAVEPLIDHVTSIERDFGISIQERTLVANRVEQINKASEMVDGSPARSMTYLVSRFGNGLPFSALTAPAVRSSSMTRRSTCAMSSWRSPPRSMSSLDCPRQKQHPPERSSNG